MCFTVFFFQAEDGIRDSSVTGVRRVLFRSPSLRPESECGRSPSLGERPKSDSGRREGTPIDPPSTWLRIAEPAVALPPSRRAGSGELREPQQSRRNPYPF